jgi:hypothetical protein
MAAEVTHRWLQKNAAGQEVEFIRVKDGDSVMDTAVSHAQQLASWPHLRKSYEEADVENPQLGAHVIQKGQRV